MTDILLKPCPFCGDTHLEIMYNEKIAPYPVWAVHCSWCLTIGPRNTKQEKAIAEWNERKEIED